MTRTSPMPLIGVTLDAEPPGGYSKYHWYALRANYSSAIAAAGGLPVALPHHPELVEAYLDRIDALVITGGAFDVDPALYGTASRHETVSLKENRTTAELALLRAALDRDMPTLGICGGQQLLAVALGGTLIQHIPDSVPDCLEHEQKKPHGEPAHPVQILPGTLLARITGRQTMQVNSSHHQAVATPGRATTDAIAPDGVIEGIEDPAHRFCLGVQWHPEFATDPADARIFAALIAALPMTAEPTPQAGDRIAKFLSRAGVASRRDAERMLAEGRIALNGAQVTHPATFVTPSDIVQVDGRVVGAPERTRLWRYHKPEGLVTTHKDPEGRPTVFDKLPPGPRVLSIGRLDLNSEGLLLLTNDGALARQLELPATGWIRRYRVRVYGLIDERRLANLAHGTEIDGIKYGPIDAAIDSKTGDNSWLSIGLREGRNREIRKVMLALGLQTTRLIRISYGPFQLGLLPRAAAEEVPGKVLREQLPKAP